MALTAVATAWFLSGIGWGIPNPDPEFRQLVWGPDELAPLGVTNLVDQLLGRRDALSPQYPLGHYFVQAIFVLPYRFLVAIADDLGLPPQSTSTWALAFLHRMPSALMGAGAAVAAGVFVQRATDSAPAGWLTAVLTATSGPVVYYARTSNVDVPSLFWTASALVVALRAARVGLNGRRAALLGVLAAMAIATKDQQYAYFVGLGVVLAFAHLGRNREPHLARWKPLLVGVGVAGTSYLLVSGAVLQPAWFQTHVDFVLHGSGRDLAPEIRQLIGFYGSSPATLAGYGTVLTEAVAQLLAGVGLPVLVLAIAGCLWLWRTERALLALLAVPTLFLFVGVILPVRFVLPRFLLPVDLSLCVLAGIALARLGSRPSTRRIALGTAVAVMGLHLMGGLDLTVQMHRDSRYEVAEWLDRNLAPGDTLGYFGASMKLPRVRRDLFVTPAPGQYLPDEVYGGDGPRAEAPTFLIIVPQQMTEVVHEWTLPDSTFARLLDGSAGYELVLAVRSETLFPRPLRVASFVNPPVRVFARRDRVSRLVDEPRLDLPTPTTVP